MKKALTYNIIICAAIASQICAYVTSTDEVGTHWYKFNALTMFLSFTLPVFSDKLIKNDWGRTFTMYALIMSFNQLTDEFFLDPTKLQWNEVLVGAFCFFHLLAKIHYAIKQRL